MPTKNLIILSLLIILLLCLRLSIILFSFDNIYPGTDDLSRGTLAKEIIAGRLTLPLFDYLEPAEYEGGWFISPISAVPFFLIFGDSYFSLKLVAVFYSIITFIFWYILLIRFFNPRIALFWSLLFILSPPFYTIISLIFWGKHTEYYFFTALFFIFFFKIFFQDGLQKTKARTWIIFGLLSGLSFWIIQSNAIVLVTCFLIFFITDTKFFFKKPFLIYTLSFLVGYSPEIYHFFTRHWQYEAYCFNILTYYPIGEEFTRWLPKLSKLLFIHLPQSFMFKYGIISYFYYLFFLISFFYLLWLNRKTLLKIIRFLLTPITLKKVQIRPQDISSELPFLFYFLAYLLIYTIGGYSVWEWAEGLNRYIYFSIIYPVVFLIIAFFLNRLWELHKKKIAIVFICFFALLGLYANINLISFRNFGGPLKEKGYSSYYELGCMISEPRTIKGVEVVLGHLRWINPQYAPDFFMGIGTGMGYLNKTVTYGVAEILALFSKIPQKYQIYLYQGWGRGLGPNELFLNNPTATTKTFAQINVAIDDKYKQSFYRGIGEGLGLVDIDEQKRSAFILNTIDKKYWPWVMSGLKDAKR